MHLGYFDSEIEAAREYDLAATKYFGAFAKTNFPTDLQRAASWERAVRKKESPFRGVSRNNTFTTRWKAMIELNGKQHYLGYFPSQEEAALAYNAAAIKIHGASAKINVIKEV